MSDLVMEISRYKANTYFIQEYKLAYQEMKTIFWWLTKIKEELDSSLAFECSCCSGLCGACGIRVNGRSVLACKTILTPVLNYSSVLKCKIEPLRGLPLLRDLMINWRPVTERLKKNYHWLVQEQDSMTTLQYSKSQEESTHDQSLAGCIQCGICASECPILSQDHFIEPFIFAKAYRLITDSRLDPSNRQSILENVQPFLSQCIHCGRCRDTCPKSVSPAAAIVSLKKHLSNLYKR